MLSLPAPRPASHPCPKCVGPDHPRRSCLQTPCPLKLASLQTHPDESPTIPDGDYYEPEPVYVPSDEDAAWEWDQLCRREAEDALEARLAAQRHHQAGRNYDDAVCRSDWRYWGVKTFQTMPLPDNDDRTGLPSGW